MFSHVAEIPKNQKRPDTVDEAVMGMIRGSSQLEPALIDLTLMSLANRFGLEAYSAFFRGFFHVETLPKEAKFLWNRVLDFHGTFKYNFTEPVDFRVSALFYLINIARILHNPVMVEAEQYQKLVNDSLTDAMTGLHNFRFFQKMVGRDFEHAKRYNQPLSLIFLDIDNFKNFNDLYGHTEGDQVIKFVAEAIQTSIRWSDWACRYGGEEFVVVASGTTKEGTIPLANRISRKLSHLKSPPFFRNGTSITVSAGVAGFPHDAQRIEDLIKRADEALYLAKERGKNRVELYPNSTNGEENLNQPQNIFKKNRFRI